MTSDYISKIGTQYRLIKSGRGSFFLDGVVNIFLYIGENPDILKKISDTSGVGYSSAVNFRQASSFIPELQRKKVVLNAIFIDLPYDLSGVKQLLSILDRSVYRSVPVIHLSTNLTEAGTLGLKKACLVDDIIHPVRDLFTVRERLVFLTRIKHSLSKASTAVTVDKYASAIDHTSIFKRAFDILLSSFLILLLLPLFLIIALLIKLDSSGPVFYNSYRAGRGFRVFKYFKFRTMKVGADRMTITLSQHRQHGGKTKGVFPLSGHDPRVTSMGEFLRRTGLEELPQLFNVFKGDMSVVGNRPLPLYEASCLTTNESAERFVAPAGIIELWKVRRKAFAEVSDEDRNSLDVAKTRPTRS